MEVVNLFPISANNNPHDGASFKLRVTIGSGNREVVFDWLLDQAVDCLYFGCSFVHPGWKVLVFWAHRRCLATLGRAAWACWNRDYTAKPGPSFRCPKSGQIFFFCCHCLQYPYFSPPLVRWLEVYWIVFPYVWIVFFINKCKWTNTFRLVAVHKQHTTFSLCILKRHGLACLYSKKGHACISLQAGFSAALPCQPVSHHPLWSTSKGKTFVPLTQSRVGFRPWFIIQYTSPDFHRFIS